MNPDLARERVNCPFSGEEITNLLDGGPKKTQFRRDYTQKFLQSEVSKRPTRKGNILTLSINLLHPLDSVSLA